MKRTLSNITMRKKGSRYYARLYDPSRRPKRKEIALRTSKKRPARKRLTQLEAQYERGEVDPWTDPVRFEKLTIQDAIQVFLNAKQDVWRSTTHSVYKQQLEAWERLCPPTLMLKALRAEHLRPYIYEHMEPDSRANTLSSATKRKRYRHIRAFINWLMETGRLTHNPLNDISQPDTEKKSPVFLSRKGLGKLLSCIQNHGQTVTNQAGQPSDVQWLVDLINVAVCTGMRRGELVNLQWQDVSLEKKVVAVRNRGTFTTKNGHERRVPIRADALATLRRTHSEREPAPGDMVFVDRRGRAIRPDRATKRFKFFVRKADLPDSEALHFHSLRHTCGTWLASNGVSIRLIQEILGHTSHTTSEIYAHISLEAAGRAIEHAFGKEEE